MKTTIKERTAHFHIFCIYLKIDYEECRDNMKSFFQKLEDSGLKVNSDNKIDDWFDGRRNPQLKGKNDQIKRINVFFERLAESLNSKEDNYRVWDYQWLTTSIDNLEKDSRLYGAVRKYKQPYAISRFHKDFSEHSSLAEDTRKTYCHRCFFIYRIHSTSNALVRDVLRIHGHSEENIFCNINQFSDHVVVNPKHTNWHHIERYNGNVVFNASVLNILLASPEYPKEHGPNYTQLIIPRFYNHSVRIGLGMSLTDSDFKPIAGAIYVQQTNFRNIEPENMNLYVGEIKGNDKREKEDCISIREKLINQSLTIEQPKTAPYLHFGKIPI